MSELRGKNQMTKPIDIGGHYKITTTSDGKTRIVADENSRMKKLDVSTRIKMKKSKRIRYKPAKSVNRPI
jgi:hypothetical protein